MQTRNALLNELIDVNARKRLKQAPEFQELNGARL